MTDRDMLVTQIKGDINRLEHEIAKAQSQICRKKQCLDEIFLEDRPEYPTKFQLDALPEAARRIKAGESSRSIHGDPINVDTSKPWIDHEPFIELAGPRSGSYVIFFRQKSPLRPSGGGGRLWRASESEVESMVASVLAADIHVVSFWTADDTVSIEVRAK